MNALVQLANSWAELFNLTLGKLLCFFLLHFYSIFITIYVTW